MIFPNNSSGSDVSVGEGEPGAGLDQSLVLLEPSELLAENEQRRSNIWRLYFGSSCESELDSQHSGQVSTAVRRTESSQRCSLTLLVSLHNKSRMLS